MTDVVEGSPLITEPEVLSPDALKEAGPDLLSQLNASKPPRQSRSKKQSMVTPPPRRRVEQVPAATDDDELKRKEAERLLRYKKQRTDEWTEKIVQDANDQIFGILIAFGIPGELIYKDGSPKSTQFRTDLTDTGNMLAIKPNQARNVGAFLTELETGTSAGQALSAVNSGGPLTLVLKGLAAGWSVYQYMTALNNFRKMIEPLLEARKRAEQMQAEQEKQQEQTHQKREMQGVML